MKLILKDGTEFTISAISFNYGMAGNVGEGMTYEIVFEVPKQPTALINEINSKFTADNLSAVKTVDSSTGEEEIAEFEFSTLLNIGMNITESGKKLSATVK